MTVPFTRDGYDRLREELNQLIQVKRPRIVADIAEAREHGDLSENAEYHAAKEQQGLNESRIVELQNKLASAQIIDTSRIQTDQVVFGATVVLQDLDNDSIRQFTLVGPDESDLERGRISVQSPVGRALLHHAVGDVVEVETPSKKFEYEIKEIRYDGI